jgi:hypothetical protein
MIRGDREYRREKLGIGRPSASQYGASQYCAPAESTKKWTPGIYHEVSAMGSSRANEWNQVKARLTPKDDGVMMRFDWSELEKDALGSYSSGFNLVQGYIDQLADLDKQLMLFMQFKTFGGNAVPKYMRDSAKYSDGREYSGCQNGQFAYSSDNGGTGGYFPNMHVTAVRERFEALMCAYAERFDLHPNFECWVMSEACINKPKGSPDPWPDQTRWYSELAKGLVNTREAWSNSQICCFINAPRKDMETFVPQLLDSNIGIGITDVVPDEKGLNYRSDVPNRSDPRGAFEWAELCAGKAIIIAHMSKPAYFCTVVARGQTQGQIQGQPRTYPTYPGNAKTRQQTHDFAVNTLKATHCVYIHNTSVHPHAGDEDPNAGDSAQPYKTTSDEFSGQYAGKKINLITDNFLAESEETGTITTRPDNW